ncbi:hypothetical protein F5884DRAFT_645552, partial [Xylogone sp. PMI_703]
YEALFYDWKKYEGEDHIKCRTPEIRVALNLQMALRSLRSASVPLIIWADAACI